MKPRSTDNIAGHQFRWLRAIRDGLATEKRRHKADREAGIKGLPARITEADVVFAVDLTEFMQGRLDCFRSAAALAVACGYSENAADAGLRRLVDAGFLEKLPPEKGDTNGKGRPASRYRVPDNFPILNWGNVSPSCVGENPAISPSRNGTLSPSPLGNDKIHDQRAKAPKAPSTLLSVSCVSDVDSENGRYGADDCANRPFSQEPDSGPKEDDETIIVPPDDPRPLPELPASWEEEWRKADEDQPPPDPGFPDDATLSDEIPWGDDENDVAEEIEDTFDDMPEDQRASFRTIANLMDADPRQFVETAFAGFSGGDDAAAQQALTIIKDQVQQLRQDGESYRAIAEDVIAPLVKALCRIAESRAMCEEDVDVLTQNLTEALRFGVPELVKGATYG